MGDLRHRLLQLVIVPIAELFDAILSVQPLPDDFVGLDKLVNLPGQFIILVAHNPDMVIHGLNLDLQIRIVLQQGRVGVACSLQLLSHVHELVLFLTNFHLQLLDGSTELDILAAFLVDSLLKFTIFFLVALLKALEVVKLIHEVTHLRLQRSYLTISLVESLLFVFKVKGLLVNRSIKLFNLVKCLRDFKF